jgi:hypothetical protein
VKKVLEGTNSTIRGKNLKAKMLNAKELSINCSETADIEAIYSESTEVQAKAANIGLCRGVIKVSPPPPPLSPVTQRDSNITVTLGQGYKGCNSE